MSNHKAELHNVNAHIIFGENALRITQVLVLKVKYGCVVADNCQNRQNSTISNRNADVHNINAHTKFGENLLILSKVIVQK